MTFHTPTFLRSRIFALTENLNQSKQHLGIFLKTCYSTGDIPESDNDSSRCKTRILKVAIVGDPNAGKSTLINSIVGKNVFAMSNKVHTTRCRARAVYVKDNTQLVFVDTPGLVNNTESKTHHLDHTYITDGEEAVKEADVIGVVHDVANKYTIFKLSQKVLRLLHFYSSKPSFLILNKVDRMKSKRDLLDCVEILTNRKRDPRDEIYFKRSLTENELQDMLKDEVGWSHFRDIFMVSALNRNGVGDIREYLLDLAQPGEWLFSSDEVTDQEDITLIQNVVFAKLLDEMSNEIAYNLLIHIDYFNKDAEGDLYVAVLVGCSKPRIERLIVGKGGARVLKIARAIEQDLSNFFFKSVHVRLVVTNKEEVERYGAPIRLPSDAVDANVFKNASG